MDLPSISPQYFVSVLLLPIWPPSNKIDVSDGYPGKGGPAPGSEEVERKIATDTNPASTGVYGRIYLNHKLIYEHFVAGTDGVGVDYSLTETFNSGDILDFVVAPNGPAYNDSTLFSSYVIATVSSVPPGSAPSITAVVSAATGQAGVAPGGYVSIYGSNFAPAGFLDTWSNSVIGGKLPVKLDGVSVSIGGQAAYVAAVTPNQINVVAPNATAGPLQVTVNTAAGTSAPFAATAQAVEPGIFARPGNQAVATHIDYSYAVQNGTFLLTTVPARSGEGLFCGRPDSERQRRPHPAVRSYRPAYSR